MKDRLKSLLWHVVALVGGFLVLYVLGQDNINFMFKYVGPGP